MKYIQPYNKLNESESNLSLSKEDIEDVFSNSFDLSKDHSIDIVYFGVDDDYAHNDFSNPNSDYHPDKCEVGYQVSFKHDFYHKSNLLDFQNYIHLLNEIKNDINKLKGMHKISQLFFDDASDDSITIIIKGE